jgi:Zn ribbon nucleic-acid-binding protein
MYDIFRDKYCPQCCFKSSVHSTELESVQIVECLRDNEDVKDRFRHTSNVDDLQTWILQSGNFLHCLYAGESAKSKWEK